MQCKSVESRHFLKMFAYPFIFVAVLIFPQHHALQNKTVTTQTIRSALGKYLRGHVFDVTSQAADLQHCLADCWAENDRCQSFNYHPSLDVCELNDASNLTAPRDLIDKANVVYLTNPLFGRKKIPQMPRHSLSTSHYSAPSPCKSNPCKNGGKCSPNSKLGFLCHSCDDGFYGQMCEERKDPCASNPCEADGICKSNQTDVWCICKNPDFVYGTWCENAYRDFQFNFNGSREYPTLRNVNTTTSNFVLFFWFKTTTNCSHFMSFLPKNNLDDHVLSLWRNGSTIFLELLRHQIWTYDFPYSYPLNDNKWHSVTVVVSGHYVTLALDGTIQHDRRTSGKNVYKFLGTLRLGYYEETNGTARYFHGSIGSVDMKLLTYNYPNIHSFILGKCLPVREGIWAKKPWNGYHMAQRPVEDCKSREQVNSCPQKLFVESKLRQWMETNVTLPRHLTCFTLSFHMVAKIYTNHSYQIACYGADGVNCALSVVIHMNMTLEIFVNSTSVVVDLVPIFDDRSHHVVITWTNVGGVLEVIVDNTLQSRISDVENNGQIAAQSRFLIAGNDMLDRSFIGHMNEFNVWDEVLSGKIFEFMASTPGKNRGNFVAWRDFVAKPNNTSSIKISQHSFTPTAARNRYIANYRASGSGHYMKQPLDSSVTAFTFVMWINLNAVPALLLSAKSLRSPQDVTLSFDDQAKLKFAILNTEFEVASYNSFELLEKWRFVSITWDTSGKLESNLDGNYTLHNTTFAIGHVIHGNSDSKWYLGNKTFSLTGLVTGANIWNRALPIATIRAMARGSTNMESSGLEPSWGGFYSERFGRVSQATMSKKYCLPTRLCETT